MELTLDQKIAILGDISKKFENKVSLNTYNMYIKQLGYEPLSPNDLECLISLIKDEKSKYYTIYFDVKSGNKSVEEYLKGNDLPSTFNFKDSSGIPQTATRNELATLIVLKDKLSAKRNNNVDWNAVFRVAKKNGLYYDDSIGFIELLNMFEKEFKQVPNIVRYNKEQQKDVDKALSSDYLRMASQKREIQNSKRELGKLQRNLLDEYLYHTQLVDAIPSHLNVGRLKPLKNSKGKDTLLVFLSDLHVGLKTDDFDVSVLKNRLKAYLGEIKDQVDYKEPKDIMIINIGDNIENVYMHPNQMYNTELDLSEQVAKSIELVLTFIKEVRNLGYKTSYTGIAGNHDRLNGNKKQAIVGDSVSRILNEIIKNFADTLDITFVEPKEQIRTLISVNGLNIAITHGDYDKLANKDIISKLSEYFNEKVDLVIGGHLHNLNIKTLGKKQYVIQSGAMFTGNSYSNSLGVVSDASQVMLRVDKQGNIKILPIIL